jgi:hypothetical protein
LYSQQHTKRRISVEFVNKHTGQQFGSQRRSSANFSRATCQKLAARPTDAPGLGGLLRSAANDLEPSNRGGVVGVDMEIEHGAREPLEIDSEVLNRRAIDGYHNLIS